MKIALDTRPLLEDVPGGVRTYTIGLSNELRAAGHDVVEWTNSFGTTHIPNKLLNPLFRFVGWPKVDDLVARRAERGSWGRLASRRGGRPDWLVMPNPNFIALSGQTKLAVVFHDLSFEVNPSWFSPKERLWHRLVRPRELAARADRVIAVSEWTKRDLVEIYGMSQEKVVIVTPIVTPHLDPLPQGERNDFENPPNQGERNRSDISLPGGEGIREGDDFKIFLYLGSLSRRKNVIGLVRAFESVARDVPAARLILAGPDGYGAADVRRAVVTSPMRDRIKLCGVVSEEEKSRLMSSATAFVYPSFYEGYGIPVVEAMAAGLPVIVSNRSSLPEVAGGAGLLVDPYDVSTIAHAMQAVLTDQSLRDRLAQQSRERALTLTLSQRERGTGSEKIFSV